MCASSSTSSSTNYELNDFQNRMLDDVLSNIRSIYEHNEELKTISIAVIKHYLIAFTKPTSNVFRFKYRIDGKIKVRVTPNRNIFVDIIGSYLTLNVLQFGVFTEYWPSMDEYLNEYFNNVEHDTHHSSLLESLIINDVAEESFEINREETIDKLYSVDKNTHHPINYTSVSVKRTSDNKECRLCFSKSSYLCSHCKYPLCSDCIDTLIHTNGKCPCCQCYPMVVDKIK